MALGAVGTKISETQKDNFKHVINLSSNDSLRKEVWYSVTKSSSVKSLLKNNDNGYSEIENTTQNFQKNDQK